ncbi:hypothetical protein B5F76_08680 [Desulfovibrio sp. An276]|nr:hypothetical protein B5F76_08680 [Desulfovibrio sp. An276]
MWGEESQWDRTFRPHSCKGAKKEESVPKKDRNIRAFNGFARENACAKMQEKTCTIFRIMAVSKQSWTL